MRLEQVRDDLGVRLGAEDVAVGDQPLLEHDVVLDDAVEHHGEAAVAARRGWALASDGRPWVAQRVCPMPVVAGEPFVPATCFRTLRLPTARTTSSTSPSISEMPAES